MIWAISSYCVSLLLLAGYAIVNTRLDGYRKWLFIPMFLCLMGFAIVGFVQSLGYPIPLWTQFEKKDINVSWYLIDEVNEAIYVWGYLKGSDKPVSLELEFSKETAQQLHDLRQKLRQSDEGGENVSSGISGSFIAGSYQFHENPPVRLEQKD